MSGAKGGNKLFFRGFLVFILCCAEVYGSDAGISNILNNFPVSKQQDFISRKWTHRDTALRFAQEESVQAASTLALMLASRVVVNALMSSIPLHAVSIATFGAQTAMDYARSSSMQDFYLRSGSNLANRLISGSPQSYWRQGVTFALGHSMLMKRYWPEIYGQLQHRHKGIRRIWFISPVLNKLIVLKLVTAGRQYKRAGLVINFGNLNVLPAQGEGLTGDWLALASACRNHNVTSINIQPDSTNGMHIKLWRHDRMLSESRLVISSETEGARVWLTDRLAEKSWPKEFGYEPVINPLTAPVISSLAALVSGEDVSVVPVHQLPSVVSPKGRLALFPTGTDGYLLVDRNKTVDIELPELWLNTDQPFRDEMEVSLAQLERQQIPGRWRGLYGLGLELGRSYAIRSLLYAGLNRFRKSTRALQVEDNGSRDDLNDEACDEDEVVDEDEVEVDEDEVVDVTPTNPAAVVTKQPSVLGGLGLGLTFTYSKISKSSGVDDAGRYEVNAK